MLELLVNIAELTQAAAKMQQALSQYQDAVDAVKTAADQLAQCWEGEGQVAFVEDQAQAYNWYFSLVDIVLAMINEAKKIAENYRQNIESLKSIMQGN